MAIKEILKEEWDNLKDHDKKNLIVGLLALGFTFYGIFRLFKHLGFVSREAELYMLLQ